MQVTKSCTESGRSPCTCLHVRMLARQVSVNLGGTLRDGCFKPPCPYVVMLAGQVLSRGSWRGAPPKIRAFFFAGPGACVAAEARNKGRKG